MAATLAHIKSKMLLPPSGDGEDEEKEEDPRAELVKRLLQYQRYKESAGELEKRVQINRDVFARKFASIDVKELSPDEEYWANATVFDLIGALKKVFEKKRIEIVHEIILEKLSVADKMKEILNKLTEQKGIEFESFFTKDSRKIEVIVTFLAILELIRLGLIKALQTNDFGTIKIYSTISNDEIRDIKIDEEDLYGYK